MSSIKPNTLSDAALEHELLHPASSIGPAGRGRSAHASRVQRQLDIARELLLRRLAPALRDQRILDAPAKLHDWLQLQCGGLEHEVFLVLYLNTHHQLIDAEPLFRGGLAETRVPTREVVKAALAHNAAAVIVAHNHPGADLTPSSADLALTIKLQAALAVCDMRLLDHFLVAGERIVSFAEQHWL